MNATFHSTAHRSRGFTLVEVLVAMIIMAMIAAMAWQGVDGIVKARSFSQGRLQQTLRLNTVIAQWEQDLASIQETTAVPGLSFDGSTARLTRRAERGLQIVTWSLKPAADGTAGGGTWLRWASPAVTTNGELQDLWMRTQQFQGVEAGQLQTLKGISQWQMYCYWGSWSNCQSTGDQQAGQPAGSASAPAATQRQALPGGVRVVLEFSGGDLSGTLMRDVALGP